MTTHPDRSVRPPSHIFVILALCTVALVWSYWTTLGEIIWRWNSDPQYSHGYLVPLFAAYMLWLRRDMLADSKWKIAPLGLFFVGVAMALRLAGARFHLFYLDQISLLPAILGVMMLAFGSRAMKWGWPAVAFLFFMVPLPHSISMALAGPMQTFATQASTFVLQTLGKPAVAEGNVILLNDLELGIVEACSGLRMLVVFFALSTAVAFLIEKPLWEKLVVAASAIPIALVANVLRIALTGWLCDTFSSSLSLVAVHDAMGWAMMPIGLAFLWTELLILRNLLIDTNSGRPAPSQITFQTADLGPILVATETRNRKARAATKPSRRSAEQVEPAEQS